MFLSSVITHISFLHFLLGKKPLDDLNLRLHVWPIWRKGIILTIHSLGGSS